MERGLVWFRRDLRVRDHSALSAACEECREVVALFVFDAPLLQSRVFGSACVTFMLGCLAELRHSCADLGVTFRHVIGEPVESVVQTAAELGVEAVYWNRDYEPSALTRDQAVQRRLIDRGCTVKTFKDHVVFESAEVRGLTGNPFQRYSAYRDRWWSLWRAGAPAVLHLPPCSANRTAGRQADLPPLPSAADLGYEERRSACEPGEAAARARLNWFLRGPIHAYVGGRNIPALDGTSALSPHFRFGTLSARTAVHAALGALSKGGAVSRADVLTWVDELVWREFFQQVLTAFPHVADGPFKAKAGMPPSIPPGPERDRLFAAWCEGRTGYPIVDAGMRQLAQTGWMHNRIRMVVASFLVKDLRVDWRSGERYFMHQLIDADLAANNGNWQWTASTGTDAIPGYRIFNPALQSKKFDPDGRYIRRYVPELAGVPTAWIHAPHLMPEDQQLLVGCRIGSDYPAPIFDHAQARQAYLRESKRQGVV